MRSASALLVLAIAVACGGDDDTDTGADDDASASLSSASASSSESDGSASMSGSMSASVGESSGVGESSEGSATQATSEGTTTDATADGSSSGPGESSDSGGSESGGLCSGMDETCAHGELCCQGLTCCAGVPVPMGQEYCAVGCPDSDRNIKENFAAIDTAAMLAEIAALPITSWNYTFEDPRVRHIGPMAQDFSAAFAVGATDKAIAKVDADGVALAAIQALHRRTGELREANDDLRERLAKLERAIEMR